MLLMTGGPFSGLPTPLGPVSFAWWDYLLVFGFSIGIAALMYNMMKGRFDDGTRFITAMIATLVLWFALPSLCFAVGYALPHPYHHIMAMESLGHAGPPARQRIHWVFTLRETDGPGRYRFGIMYSSYVRALDLYHVRQNDCFGVSGIAFPGGLALYDEHRTACPTRISGR